MDIADISSASDELVDIRGPNMKQFLGKLHEENKDESSFETNNTQYSKLNSQSQSQNKLLFYLFSFS